MIVLFYISPTNSIFEIFDYKSIYMYNDNRYETRQDVKQNLINCLK